MPSKKMNKGKQNQTSFFPYVDVCEEQCDTPSSLSQITHPGKSLCKDQKNRKKTSLKFITFCMKRSRRTKVLECRWKSSQYDRKMEQNSFFKFRMMSKKYLRKLSCQTQDSEPKTQRKVSWNDEVEVLVFKKEQKADMIGRAHIRKESLTETLKYHTFPELGEIIS